MSVYSAPLDDMRFTLREIVGFDKIAALPGFDGTDQGLTDQILEEAGKFSRDVLAPLSKVGDQKKARLENGVVRAVDGFSEAYSQFWQGGWNAMPFEEEFGGQEFTDFLDDGGLGDVEQCRSRLRSLPAADASGHRGHGKACQRRTEGKISA